MSDVWTPPRAEVKDIGLSGNPDAPEIRRLHIGHEASVKAIGMLYYIGAAGLLVVGIIALIGAAQGEMAVNIGIGLAMLAFCALYVWIGRGLRTLNPKVKIPAGVLAGIGLIGFPVGTLINGYILYLLFSQKGTMVFSDDYKQIIADTPDVKYRTSVIVWIFLALLVVLFVGGMIAAMMEHR